MMDKINLLVDRILFGTVNEVIALLNLKNEDSFINYINDIDDYGYRPLIEAVIANKPDMVSVLLQYGADVNIKDCTGRSALHWAVDNSSYAISEILLKNKADANAYTNGSQSVLVSALLHNDNKLKQLLYSYGARLDFAKDFINTKLLSHRYQLTDSIDIYNGNGRFLELDLEGFILNFTVSVIRDSLERYIKNFSARTMKKYFPYIKIILNAFKKAENLLKYQNYLIDIKEYGAEIDHLLSFYEPIFLPIAYEGHAIAYIFYKNLVICCDRGEDSLISGSIIVYQARYPENLTKVILKNLIYKNQSHLSVKEALNQYLGLIKITNLQIQGQIAGNCSWANIEIVIPAIMFLLLLNTNNHKQDLDAYKNISLIFYMRWCQWDKDCALNDCIDSFYYADNPRKLSIASLLAAILIQQCNYLSVKETERAEKILNILQKEECNNILMSYIDTYKTKSESITGKNFFMLLDMCGIKPRHV